MSAPLATPATSQVCGQASDNSQQDYARQAQDLADLEARVCDVYRKNKRYSEQAKALVRDWEDVLQLREQAITKREKDMEHETSQIAQLASDTAAREVQVTIRENHIAGREIDIARREVEVQIREQAVFESGKAASGRIQTTTAYEREAPTKGIPPLAQLDEASTDRHQDVANLEDTVANSEHAATKGEEDASGYENASCKRGPTGVKYEDSLARRGNVVVSDGKPVNDREDYVTAREKAVAKCKRAIVLVRGRGRAITAHLKAFAIREEVIASREEELAPREEELAPREEEIAPREEEIDPCGEVIAPRDEAGTRSTGKDESQSMDRQHPVVPISREQTKSSLPIPSIVVRQLSTRTFKDRTDCKPNHSCLSLIIGLVVPSGLRRFRALIYSGSFCNILASGLVIREGVSSGPSEKYLQPLSGDAVASLGRAELEVVAEDSEGWSANARHAFEIVAPAGSYEVILGQSWLSRVDPDIRFSTKDWRYRFGDDGFDRS